MPVLGNQRHEQFAQALASGMCVAEAYAAAGYSHDRGNAARLTAYDSIQARVRELQDRAAADVVITREYLLEQQHALLADAWKAGEFSAANTALKQLVTLACLYAEKREVEGRIEATIAREPLSFAAWEAKRCGDRSN